MVVTPDNRTLIVSESFTGKLLAFDIAGDGTLSRRRVWAEGIAPDGICLDEDGAVWTGTWNNECVRVAEGGEILDRIQLDRPCFATMLGGLRSMYAIHDGEPVPGRRQVRRDAREAIRSGAGRAGAHAGRRLAVR